MKFQYLSAAALAVVLAAGSGVASAQTADPEETWKPIGTGLIRDDIVTKFYFTNDYWEFPVEIEESEQTPGRYRLVNAYQNCPSVGGGAFPAINNYLVVDASDPVHVYIEPACVNYYIGQDQAMCVWSMAEDYYHNKYGDWVIADAEGICGTLADGAITFPMGSVLATPIDEIAYDPAIHDLIWHQVNQHGMFRIKLPDTPATDVDITFVGVNDAKNGVQYDLRLSSDIENAKIAVFEGEYTKEMRTQIENGSVKTYDFSASGVFTAPYEKDGNYTLVVVPYAKGRSWAPSYLTRQWSFSEAEWKKIGKGAYTETIIASNELKDYGLNYNEYTYDVEVEQSVAEPWVIRIVDPYSPDRYPVATAINYDSSKHYYLYFDMGCFECVHMRNAESIGLNLGLGRMCVRSSSDYYMNANPYAPNMTLSEYLADETKPKGIYNDETKTITYEPNGLRIMFPDRRPDTWYYANMSGNAKLQLPSDIVVTRDPSTSVSGIETDENAEVEYFTTDGMKVDGKNLGTGIYIVRKGSKVSKVLVK